MFIERTSRNQNSLPPKEEEYKFLKTANMLVIASRVRYDQVFDQTRILHSLKQMNKTSRWETETIINRNLLLSFHDNNDSLPPRKQ